MPRVPEGLIVVGVWVALMAACIAAWTVAIVEVIGGLHA